MATSGSSRWWRTIACSTATSSGGKPHAGSDRRRAARCRRRCGRPGSPCRRRAAARRARAGRAGRCGPRATAALAAVSIRCRSTVKRWYALRCGLLRRADHSGNTGSHRPSWSSASITGMAWCPASSRSTSAARTGSGHGSGSGPTDAASRSSEPRLMRTPPAAAAAAARRTSEGSSPTAASAVRWTSPSRSTRPRPRALSRRDRNPSGPLSEASMRDQASSLRQAIVRAAAATSRIRSSALA